MECEKEKDSTAGDISPLRPGSDASTFPNSSSPERPSVPLMPGNSSGARQATSMNIARVRKRARHEQREANRVLRRVGSWDLGATLLDPGLVMKVSTLATISGTVCVLLAVFSGPVLVYMAVLTLGVCGVCYSIRQRGALEYLPRGLVELLTRTTLLEFLTDTTLFDAIKNYLVFMMGLSEEETERVLRSLPEGMRNTLTRPGLMHTLPTPLQSLLLPMNQSASTARSVAGAPRSAGEGGRGSGLRRRRHRPMAEASENRVGEVNVAVALRAGDSGHEEREATLGQLVWNPLPFHGAPETPSPFGGGAAQNELQMLRIERGGIEGRSDDDGSESSVIGIADRDGEGEHPEEKIDVNEGREQEEARAAVRRRGVIDHAMGQNGGRSSNHRQPWARSPQRSRSLSPLVARHQERARAPVDGNRAGASAQPSQGLSRVSPESRRTSRGIDNPGGDGRGYNAGLELTATGLVPSAERIVASIVQSRVDNALKAAWNLVDERGVRRAALGSGVALATHMALSKGARRQATLMLRGGLLACLAGTATVCAGLVYVKRRGPSLALTGAGSGGVVDRAQTVAEEEPAGDAEHSPERDGEDSGGRRRSRLYKWLVSMKPSTRNLMRLLGMICLLLAIRKWQLLRRVTGRAIRRSSIYGIPPP